MSDIHKLVIKKAERRQAKLRAFIDGPSGSGKTTGALRVAKPFGKTVVVDSERCSASLYAGSVAEFDVIELDAPYEPEKYIEAIRLAESQNPDIIVLDSITHEWNGPGGCLDIKEKLGGRFQDWAKVTPRHDRFVQTILASKCHIIATIRSKDAYVIDDSTKRVTKVGLEPQQRDGLNFEATVVFSINRNHIAEASKDRTQLFDGRQFELNEDVGAQLKQWLETGAAPAPSKPPPGGDPVVELREWLSSRGLQEATFIAALKAKGKVAAEVESLDAIDITLLAKMNAARDFSLKLINDYAQHQ